jgi:tetratricopeptide (TPR) repeat protein
MARYFFSFSVALATVAAVVGLSSSVSAQPTVSTSGAAAPAAKEADNPEVKEGLTLLSKGLLADAIKKLHEAYLKNPKLPNEYVMLYQVFRQMNPPQANAARAMLDRAAFEYPNDPLPWEIFGEMALSEGRLAESQLDFAKANQLLEKYNNADLKPIIQQQALSGMAAIAERREKWNEAQQRLEQLLKLNPNDVVALTRLAKVKFLQSQTDEQVKDVYKDLQKAKQLDVELAAKNKTREQLLPAAAILAEYYDQIERKPLWKESTNAKKMFKYALDNNQDDLNLRSVVTVWALENGEMDMAKEQAKEALRIEEADKKLSPGARKWANSNAGRMLNGLVAIWGKKWDVAQDYFEKVFLEVPNDFAVKNNLALALVEQDDPRKKERALDLAFKNYQDNKDNNNAVDAASTLSWVYYKLDKFDLAAAAKDAVVKATNGNISNPDTATYFAHILYHSDNGHNGFKYQVKGILDNLLNKSGKPFSMKPEAQKLWELVKDEKAPESSTPTPTASNTKP